MRVPCGTETTLSTWKRRTRFLGAQSVARRSSLSASPILTNDAEARSRSRNSWLKGLLLLLPPPLLLLRMLLFPESKEGNGAAGDLFRLPTPPLDVRSQVVRAPPATKTTSTASPLPRSSPA